MQLIEPKFEIIDGKQKVVTKLNELAKKSDKIYLATDPDREGEAIAWHVRQILKVPDEKIYRIVFNEITPKAVKHSVENPRAIDMDMVQAQQTRQILDKLVWLYQHHWDHIQKLSTLRFPYMALGHQPTCWHLLHAYVRNHKDLVDLRC